MALGGRRAGRAPNSRPAASSGGSSNARRSFAQRQEKAAQKQQLPGSIHDVYDFVTEQQAQSSGSKRSRGAPADRSERRMRRTLAEDGADFERQRQRGRGLASDDDEELSDDESVSSDAKPRVPDYGTAPIFGDEDADSDGNVNGVVRSEDDEDIDSDEAFGDSDEERYSDLDLKRSGAKSKRSKRRDVGSSDEEESASDGSEGSIDDADLVDLSRMLDDDDGGALDIDDADDGDSRYSISESEGEDGSDDDRLQRRMEAYSSSMPGSTSSKRSAGEANLASGSKQRKRVLQDRTEAVPEGDWSAPTNGDALTFEDLMRPIAEQGGTSLTSLRNNAKALQAKHSSTGKQPVASKRGGGALSAPLPSIIQDRLDRSAAYDETKAEVQGWQPTIKQLREAEHLSFPLQPEPVNRPSTASMSAHFRPSNDFEASVAQMLEREGASERQIAAAEELRMNDRGMSAEEIKQRTAELRRMRELLFREEQKAKRVSKIKSKTYRKIARKQKQRELEKLREAGLDAPAGTASDDEEERLKAERLRAQERATLKHKNAGKWAKNTLAAKGLQDMPEARQALEEQLQRGEELRRRIRGDDSSDAESDSSDAGESDDGRTARDRAFDELAQLDEKRNDSTERDDVKGIMGMKFMQDAQKRRAKETQDEVAAFVKEMDDEGGDSDDADASTAKPIHVSSNGGRLVFSGANSKSRAQHNDDDRSDLAAVPTAADPKPAATIRVDFRRGRDITEAVQHRNEDNGANPWLSGPSIASKVSRKKNDALVSKNAGTESKAANRLQKQAAKQAASGKDDDGDLVIDPNQQLQLREQVGAKPATHSLQSQSQKEAGQNDSASDSDDSLADEPQEVSNRQRTAINQRDLVAEAFAGDDVLAEFAAEKQALIDAERPKEIDTSLPGWGNWGGKGVKTSKKQAEARKARFTKMTPGLDPSKRKDAGMSNVIINHKQDKKADKYKAKDVPYPYTSRAQYEMAMRNPLGPEWNTRTQHQRMTLPRVVTKPGKVIQPIERLF